MPHLHTEPNQHDFTVTAYIVRTDTSEPKVLLHAHKKLKMLLPVGGHVELDETPWQALAHEVREESGYELTQLKVLQPVSRIISMSKVVQHPYPLSMNTHQITNEHNHTDIQYGFVAQDDPSSAIDSEESADLRWLTRSELQALSPDDIYDNTREVYTFLLDEALESWEAVATANFCS